MLRLVGNNTTIVLPQSRIHPKNQEKGKKHPGRKGPGDLPREMDAAASTMKLTVNEDPPTITPKKGIKAYL